MLSGRDTLGHLDETLQTLRSQLDRLDREMHTLSAQAARSQLEQGQIIRRLAGLRLDAIESDDLGGRLNAADQRVRGLLEQRDRAIEETRRAIADADAQLSSLEAGRGSLHGQVDGAAAALAEREARAQAALEASEPFRAQLARCQDADSIAVSAAEKASVAAADRTEKRGPYDNDPLFSYLWRRKFGTSEYRANLLTRALDAWVARLCRYEQARRDYWMLLEIPKRLVQHAEVVRRHADEELEALEAIETETAAAHGVPEASSALAAAEAAQDAHDEKIRASEQSLLELRGEFDRFSAREDDYLRRCREELADAMKHYGIEHLASAALATMTLEDDNLVSALREARDEEQGLLDELAQHRSMHKEVLGRLQELADVRTRFKQRRFDDLRSGFDNGDLLLMLLQGFLAGTARGGSLWDALRRHQRYRDVAGAWPDFGSGGIGRRRGPGAGKVPRPRGPTWHWPGRRGGHKGFRLPKLPGGGRSGGGKSRGGFRTGGGF